ncbi:MAG: gliding motility-associated C-terminal domain-containing protein [Bacteroidetes bacterium]|nr:gliding motility-associated C-terminal domain-containing protein [Bacteroidota bacterium]
MFFRKIFLFKFLLLAAFFPVTSNAQSWLWAITAGGIYSDKATDMDIDTSGNLYVSGYYNVGQPATALISFGSINPPVDWGKEGFLAKVNSSGTWMWVNAAIGGYDERVLGMCTDKVNGYVYATGCTWYDIYDFNGCYTSGGVSDEVFVGKFDLNGNCIWNIHGGSDGDDHGFDLITDKQGNIYLTGFLSDHYGWFGNPGYFGSITVPMSTDSIAFAAKISPSGVFQWVRTFNGIDGERDNRIAIDTLSNIYITGGFAGSKLFGSTMLTSAGGRDVFVIKYDSNGNFIWAKRAGGISDDRGNSITVDYFGDVYVTGEFRDKAVFGTDTVNNNGGPNGRDIFVSKMKTNGNWIWAKKAGSNSGSDRGDRIISNKKGNLFVTGQFKGIASFGANITLSAAADSLQVFVAAIDTSGKWKWALAGGGTDEDRGTALACDDSCNLYNAGYYVTNASFGSNSLIGLGKKDIYVAKIDNSCFNYVTMNATATNALCNGQCNGTATAAMLGGASPYTYLWNTNPAQSTQTITGLCPGNYSVLVTDASGFSATDSIAITEPPPTPITISGSTTITAGQSITLTASGGNTYSWTNGATTASVTDTPTITTVYCVFVTDSNGCTDSSCAKVFVEKDCTGELFLPNTFSPNGDGVNDLFVISGIDMCKEFSLKIFDRWGVPMFATTKQKDYWDGRTPAGVIANEGTYYYLLTANEENKKGFVTLVR